MSRPRSPWSLTVASVVAATLVSVLCDNATRTHALVARDSTRQDGAGDGFGEKNARLPLRQRHSTQNDTPHTHMVPEGQVVLLMMVRQCFLAESLWLEYFKGHPKSHYGLLLHHDQAPEGGPSTLGFAGAAATEAGLVVGDQVHHFENDEKAERFSVSLAKQGIKMALHALEKFPNGTCFVLVSDSHLPLVPFQELRRQLLRTRLDGSGDVACMNVPVMKKPPSALDTPIGGDARSRPKMCQWFQITRTVLEVLKPHWKIASNWFQAKVFQGVRHF